MVTVRQHTAKYDAADKMKEALKKKGAGDELETRKKKLAMEQLAGKGAAEEFEKMLGDDALKENEKVKEGKKTRVSKKSEKMSSKKEPKSSKKETKSDQPFTSAEFKEWYEGTGSAADKKVAKALRKSLGRKAYNELSDLAADNYKKGGANSFFKKNVQSKDAKKSSSAKTAKEKTTSVLPKAPDYHDQYEFEPSVRKKLDSLREKIRSKKDVWVNKYRMSDANGGKRFRESLNALEKKYSELYSQHGPETPVYKEYRKANKVYYENKRKQEAAEERASRRKVSSTSKELYEKYGTSHREVNGYVKTISGGKRQWKWDAETGRFVTSRMPNGRPMKGVTFMSLESAIKKMKRAQGKMSDKLLEQKNKNSKSVDAKKSSKESTKREATKRKTSGGSNLTVTAKEAYKE